MNRPTDSVRVVIFNADDPVQFLTLAEVDDPDNWKLPGGKFDTADETPEAAAARELVEELQVEAGAVALRRAGTLTNDDGVSARYIFAATARGAQLTPSEEIAATRWVTTDTVPTSRNTGHMLSAVTLAREVAGPTNSR